MSRGGAFLGVDVGTGSARAGLFDDKGKLLGSASNPIQIWKENNCVEQSSMDIWQAVCTAVRSACSLANVAPEDVVGLGFTATCSLVAVSLDGSPVSVSSNGDSRRDILVWMDHRAVDQAERISSHDSPVLQFYGGGVSPEMQAPKLLWVKENMQESWSMVWRWMDLSNWLTYRATGDDTRSLSHMEQWRASDSSDMEPCGRDEVFWTEIGLGDLYEGSRAKIGHSVEFPGHPLGSGLTPTSAKELGLLPRTPVGISILDAYAGGVGIMESVPNAEFKADVFDEEVICHRMVLVCGTSTCHMALSKKKLFIPGVWGPFLSAMIPDFWLTECGQSATGALLDYIVQNHPAAPLLVNQAASQSLSIYELLNKMLLSMSHEQNMPFLSALSQDTHVLPDFHGNRWHASNVVDMDAKTVVIIRSPMADPKSKGVICGLTFDTSEKHLALLYLATIQGIAYGTRHIVEHCNAHGHKIDTLLASGGLAKNSLYIQEHADIMGCPIILPRENESVLLGAAILGAVAAKKFSGVHDAMKALNAPGKVVRPSSDPKLKKYHDAKYQIFRSLYEQQLSHRSVMARALHQG